MKKIYIMLFFIMIFRLASDSSAETIESLADKFIQPSTTSSGVLTDTIKPEPFGESKNDFHLEIGGNYNWLNNNYGEWKAFDLRLKYSGFGWIKPFGSISSQSRKEGSQMVYGLGSYIHLDPDFYLIAGVSGAPVRDNDVIIHPRLRMDLSAFYNTPKIVNGLVLTTGITHFPRQNGAGGDIISAGFIYYGKIIFNGSVNYNIARPGNDTSFSGVAGIMYGEEGKYWVGGGATMGKVAYQTVSAIPIDVRYETRGFNLFYTHWIGKNWGIKSRFDYNNLVDLYILNGITINFFFDF
ncbi:MAG: YaiO family outer membrane beta-barrel protein [Proteobacteria bacterium]|nr:YaiO family outer membrane beta-barrel protein [Pseudomonadota bacterium]MBU1712243.1 YaiO family outer membrane beta-barrel protein [Pseudomonadota bacterium]